MKTLSFERLKARLRTTQKKAYAHAFSRIMPYYIINEFPKSGGTWLSHMIAEALDMEFVPNVRLRLETRVVHGHFLHPLGLGNVVVIWRDPRDVLVSFYHHCFFRNEHRNAELVRLMKLNLPFDDYWDVRANLPQFIRFVSTTPFAPRFTWISFVNAWAGRPGTVQTSYEKLRHDTASELARIVGELTGVCLLPDRAAQVAENHSFAKAKAKAKATSRTKEGVEMLFVREGSTGGWRNHFSVEAIAELEALGYGEPMRRLGYEL